MSNIFLEHKWHVCLGFNTPDIGCDTSLLYKQGVSFKGAIKLASHVYCKSVYWEEGLETENILEKSW